MEEIKRNNLKQYVWVIVLLFGILMSNMQVKAESESTWNDFDFDCENNTITITGYNGSLTNLSIPATIMGMKVTGIDSYAFSECRSLTSVVIPSGVTDIGESAFSGCSGLTSVVIPLGVKSIEWGAFEGCSSLTSVTIPESVTSIERDAFSGCSGMTDINVAEKNSNYCSEEGVLFNKDKSELMCCPAGKKGKYTVPSSVITIGSDAFFECRSLTGLIISENVTSINSWAFEHCSGLTSVTILGSVTDIGESAFEGCSSLKSLTIPNSVVHIEERAFYGCSSLTSVVIPSSVTDIGGGAFYDCSGLTNVTIPKSVMTIGWNVFSGCSGMTDINVAAKNPNYCSEEGVLFNKNKSELICCPARKKGKYTVPASVTDIGGFAFSGCDGLTSVIIPESVTSIDFRAFENCSGLTSVTIPRNVTNIDIAVFSGCSGLANISVAESNSNYCSEEGVLFNKDKSMLLCCPAGKKGKYIIPESTTCIYVGAFHGCSVLTSLTIPSSVTDITLGGEGDRAFEGCNNITLFVERDSYAERVAKTEHLSYQYIDSTTEVPEEPNTEQSTTEQPTTEQPTIQQPTGEVEKVVVSNVTMIPVETQTEEKLVIDDKVKTKNGSKTVKKGTVLVSKTGIYKVTNVKKKTVKYMGIKNKKASSVKVPAEIKIKKKKYKVTSVSANAFRNNKKIKTVTIGQNVKEIGKNAFRSCKKLKKVIIGKNVTTIGDYAFYNCKNLNQIEIRSSKLKKVGKAAFKKIKKRPTVRVPKGKVQNYKKLFKGKM